jgi:hypothetical protein
MPLPFQKDQLLVAYIKEQYPDLKIIENSREARQDFYKYEPCKQIIKLSGLVACDVDNAAIKIT